ncbi:MAG: acetamidase/formamidase family protein [Trueperaceae bacterium]
MEENPRHRRQGGGAKLRPRGEQSSHSRRARRDSRNLTKSEGAKSTHVHNGWDNSLEPVLEIHPGDTIELEIVDASGGQLDKRSQASDIAGLDFSRVNPLTGPVHVRGARPGDVLEVEILELSVKDWGWTALIPGFGLLANEFPEPYLKIWELEPGSREVAFGDGISIPVNLFPGTIGVAPAQDGPHSIVPPRSCGGNMDIRHLTAGTTLYLPVQVPGALFSAGDTHVAQGDGEVCGTAIESGMTLAVRLGLRRDFAVAQPQYMIPGPLHSGSDRRGYFVTTGIHEDLMEAVRMAVRAMIRHLGERHEMTEQEAYALASVAVDLKINEVVDAPNWVVSAFLPQSIFRDGRG